MTTTATAQVRIAAFCTHCRSRCGCTALLDGGRLTAIEPLPQHPTGAKLCPKGRAAPELVYHHERLTEPSRRTAPKGAADPGWVPISWDAALDEIAPAAARQRGIAQGDWVRIRTAIGSAVARARFAPGIASDNVCAQHGWWVERPADSPYGAGHPLAANLNGVVDTSREDPVSASIPLRATWCEVERLEA